MITYRCADCTLFKFCQRCYRRLRNVPKLPL